LKVLLLNQAFYPDVVSTAQHAADLAVRLAETGHTVNVICGSRAYDDPTRTFPRTEQWKGIGIARIPTLGLGKRSKWRRALDFACFLLRCAVRLATTPRHDAVIAMTSPPLISFMATLFVRWKGGQLVYWVMDLNPDEAIAAGWLRENSAISRALQWLSRITLRRSDKVIALDRFMKTRLIEKGTDPHKVEVIPPWSHDHALSYDDAGRAAFRAGHGLEGKFVVMYSGNHSPCHPLDTLMKAALCLSDHPEIAFCFIGGGSEHSRVKNFAGAHRLSNVLCLPYQPIERLSESLASADLHAVVMGEAFAGIVHPCKIYNVMLLGIPVLYIGPAQGHIPDLAPPAAHGKWFFMAPHGAPGLVADRILAASSLGATRNQEQIRIAGAYSANVLADRIVNLLESPTSTSVWNAAMVP
jgi:colanic acid biosynthesis glycosyl transferase WcaI